MTVEEQLKSEILSRYKSIAAFTSAIGVPNSTLNSVFKRGISNAGISTMIKVFDALDLDVESIQTGTLEKKQSCIKSHCQTIETKLGELSVEEQTHIKKYRLLDPYGKEAVDGVLDVESRRCQEERDKQAAILREQREQSEAAEEIAPDASEMLVYINPAAAGTTLYAESDFERLTFPADKVPRGADFGIRISGRSMEPTVMDGSIAWVRKRQEIPNEAVGIFMLNDAAVCKRFFKKDNGSVQLKSDNPDFPDVPVTEFDNFVLVGEVIGTV